MDIDAIEQLRKAAEGAWSEASRRLDKYLRAKRNQSLASTQTQREVFANAAKRAAEAADKFLRNWRALSDAIREDESEVG